MKLFLHPGWGKTGTSSIQKYLFDNRQYLLDTFGMLYPMNGTGFAGEAHHVFSLSWGPIGHFSADIQPEELLSNLWNEIQSSGCESVLISSEIMPFVLKQPLFKDFILKAGAHIHLLFTVRQQSYLLHSNVNQLIRDASRLTYVSPFWSFLVASQHFDFHHNISTWSNSDFVDSTNVIPYSHSVLDSFLEAVFGVDNNALLPARDIRVNTSPPTTILHFMQRLKLFLIKSRQLDQMHYVEACKVLAELPESCWTGRAMWFSSREQELVDEYYKESNLKLIEQYPQVSALLKNEYHDIFHYVDLTSDGKRELLSRLPPESAKAIQEAVYAC